MANRVTDKQKGAVDFCETCLNITFTGDINSFCEVSDFLSEYLDEAKQLYSEIHDEYTSYVWSKYFE